MNVLGTWIMLAGALATGAAPNSLSREEVAVRRSAQTDLDLLQGSWRIAQMQIGDKVVDPELLDTQGYRITLDMVGDRFHFVGMGADLKGVYKLDPTSKPKRISFLNDRGQTTYSTYECEKGLLKLTGMWPGQNAKPEPKQAEVWIFQQPKR